MKNNKRNSNWVSASDVGRAVFCSHYLVLKNRNYSVSKKAIKARNEGEIGHDHLNKMAVQDKRCFVASQVYGIDDTRTNALRQWRDENLLHKCHGKIFIKYYYQYSPCLVCIARKYYFIHMLLTGLVNVIFKFLNLEDKNNG